MTARPIAPPAGDPAPSTQGDFGFTQTVGRAGSFDGEPDPEDLAETAVKRFTEVLARHPVVVAWSGGKDSSAVLVLALTAMARMKAAGVPTRAVLHIVHGDTEVENPVIRALADRKAAQLKAWSDATKIDVELVVARPKLADAFMVTVLSGSSLPVFPESRFRICAHKLKLNPADDSLKRVARRLKEEGVDAPIVTAIGTRFDESQTRERNMRRRGETSTEITDHDGRLLFSPIADWSAETVWEILATSGTAASGPRRVWAPDFADVTAAYRDAASGECPIVAGAGRQGHSGCGARFGCSVCTVLGTDRSLEAMAADARHAHLQSLLRARNFLMAIRYDWSRRSWLSRQFSGEGEERAVKIQPDHFDSRTLLELTGMYLLADHREQDRARRFDEAIRRGQTPEDVYMKACANAGRAPQQDYVETMRRPAFRFISDRHLVAVDWYSALLHKHRRPYAVLELAHRIRCEGYEPPPPTASTTPSTPAPAPRWLRVGVSDGSFTGLGSPLHAALSGEQCHGEEELWGDAHELYACRESPSFDVDEEGASLAVELLYPDQWRQVHRDPASRPHQAVQTYLATGIVSLSSQGRTRLHAIAKVRQHLDHLGLYDLSTEQLLARCLPDGVATPDKSTPEQERLVPRLLL